MNTNKGEKTFFLIVFITTIVLKLIEWQVHLKNFIPKIVKGIDYDIVDYTRLFFISMRHLFLFTDISFILMLSIFFLFKRRIETELTRNIYYSLTYLIISIIVTLITL